MTGPAIRVDGLTKYFGPVVGVEELSFEVARGEIYGFLGANGAGKTTTMRLLLDLLRPTSGRAAVLGVDCQRESLKARALIGYLPGELPTYPDLTAGGYLDYLARIDGRPVPRGYLEELLERFDVSRIDLRRRLRDQSHGMKQKIGIVQALMSKAPILILDEPTSGLDPLMVQAFHEALEVLRQRGDTTIFLSSHVLGEVESTCERIGLLRGGRMVATETIENLRRQSSRVVTVEFAAPVGRELAALAVRGESPASTETGDAPGSQGATSENIGHYLSEEQRSEAGCSAGRMPAEFHRGLLTGVTVRTRSDRRWVLEVSGPLGPLLQVLSALPVHDVQIEPFRLEDHIAAFYGVDVKQIGGKP